MLQINKLIVIEVPKGYKASLTKDANKLAIYQGEGTVTARMVTLPAPCEIIGLASEVKLSQVKKVLQAAKFTYKPLLELQGYAQFLYDNSLTDPTKDYLFLKLK